MLLEDLLKTERGLLDPPAWDERARSPGGFGSTSWLTPSKFALLSAASDMANRSGPSRMPTSTMGSIADLAGSVARGALGGAQYQEQIGKNRDTSAYLRSQNRARGIDEYNDYLWSQIPDNDPIFEGLAPVQIAGLKRMTYKEGSKALGKFRLDLERSQVLTAEQEAELGLPPDRAYRQNQVTGKVEQIGGPGSTTNINVGDTLNEGFTNMAIDRIAAQHEKADAGQDIVDKVSTMQQQLLTGAVDTGRVQSATLPLRQFAQSVGLNIDVSQDELLSSLGSYMTPRMRVTGSGATSDLEINLFEKAVPNLKNTPIGNLLVAGTIAQTSERDRRLADAMENYVYDPANKGTLKGFNNFARDNNLYQIYPRAKTREDIEALNPGTVFISPSGTLEVRSM